MKLKYLFPILIAIIALTTSCEKEDPMTLLDGIEVSSSYVAIPEDGGQSTITLTTKDSWTAEKVTTDKNKVEWLSISATSGGAGEAKLTFSAEAAIDGRTAEVLIKSGNETQRINVIQGLSKISAVTVNEAHSAPDGKTLRLTGVCTVIENTEYGNWRLQDDTGTILIYGTLDAKGQSKNFKSLNIEVGDEVTVEGPKSTYRGAAQMVDVMVIKLNKSLIKVNSVENADLPIEGGEFIAHLTCKGDGVSVDIPENAKSWLSISSIESSGESAVVTFKADANTGGDRNTTIVFRTKSGGKTYSTETTLSQKGAVVKATIAEFLAAEVGDTQYRLTGVIQEIQNTTYGNVILKDFSGEVLVYGIADFQSKDLKEGDIITIVGKRADYKGTPQVAGAVLESSISVIPATIAEVLTKPDSKEVYYMVSGVISKIDNRDYGNMYLKDGDDEIYSYGCYPGYGATGDFRKGLVAALDLTEGDYITVIAPKSTYNDVIQLNGSFYFSHESIDR